MNLLITGAASGIGRHFARTMATDGHNVLACDIDAMALANAHAANGRLRPHPLDVRSAEDWRAALAAAEAAFGPIDALCNIAGVLTPGPAIDAAFDDIDRHIDVNIKGVVLGTRIVGAAMAARGRGHLVNIASLAGIAPVPGLALYCATKFAVRGFSLTTALELRPKNVYVSVVCPDLVDTPMLDTQLASDATPITFSGGARPLSVEDTTLLLKRVLRDKPMEVAHPWHRGAMAKIVGAAPGLARRLLGLFSDVGRRRQLALRAQRRERLG